MIKVSQLEQEFLVLLQENLRSRGHTKIISLSTGGTLMMILKKGVK